MGARRPRQDKPDHGGVEFGIVTLDTHLKDAPVTYPATSDELIRALDDPEIPVDPHGHTLSLSTAIDRAGSDTFESEQAVLNELHPVFEAKRAETSIGVLGSLRAMLPF